MTKTLNKVIAISGLVSAVYIASVLIRTAVFGGLYP